MPRIQLIIEYDGTNYAGWQRQENALAVQQVLEERLRGRGTEGDEVIEARMKAAEVELSHKMEYDMWLVNDNLDEATDALVRYVNEQAEKARG